MQPAAGGLVSGEDPSVTSTANPQVPLPGRALAVPVCGTVGSYRDAAVPCHRRALLWPSLGGILSTVGKNSASFIQTGCHCTSASENRLAREVGSVPRHN